MRSMGIVEVEVSAEAGHPLGGGRERLGVSPFGEEGPNQAFGLAVRLGTIGPGSSGRDPEIGAGLAEEVAAVRVAVVGQYPLDRDALAGKERMGVAQKG